MQMTKTEIEMEIEVIHWQLSFARDRDIIEKRKARLKELELKLKQYETTQNHSKA